jgi:GAF domain-containing protein
VDHQDRDTSLAVAKTRSARARLSDTLGPLSEAIASLAAERSLPRVLQRIADLAREVVGTRYAALGLADANGRILEFYTSGLTPQERAAIGPLPRGHGLLGVLIREGRPVRIPNIGRDPRSSGFPPNHPPMTTLLGVPITSGERVLGDLYLTDRLDGHPFDADDERLAILLARHAAVAIENAAKNDELERRLEQVSSLRAFGQAIGRELGAERTLQAVAERAAELLGASLVAIALFDAGREAFTYEAAAGRRARRLLGITVPASTSILGAVARTGHGAIVEDVAHDERVHLSVLEAVGGRTGLWVPLLAGERVVGGLTALDPERGGSFAEADLRLAEAIGQQAAVAIENARLYDRARQEASTSQALLRITRAMNASLRLEEILQLIVDSMAELLGTPAGAVYLLAADGTGFELAATRALALPAEVATTSSLAELAIAGVGPGVVADTRARPDLRFPTMRDGSAPRSVAIAPIRLGERTLGVIEAYSTEPSHFSEDDRALLGAFADQAATAIESARLYGQARELALLQERDRIAKELHDGIIQTIYAVGLNLDYCRLALREDPDGVEARLGEAATGLNRAIEEIRDYILHLTRRVGVELDLREAAESLAREYRGTVGLGASPPRVTVDIDDAAARALSAERRAEVVQILREALSNASRHARAGEVMVRARADDGRFSLTVADDGIGFEPAAATADGHHGLRNMVDRARRLDGHLDIRSQPGEGTRVELVVPLAGR